MKSDGPETTGGDYRDTVSALESGLAALKEAGGDNFDVVQFSFIESLIEKAGKGSAAVANIVAKKALVALMAYQSALERERLSMTTMLAEVGARHPAAAPQLQALVDTCRFSAAKRLFASLERRAAKRPLAALLEDLESRSQTPGESSLRMPMSARLQEQENAVLRMMAAETRDATAPPAAELRSAQFFRELRQQRAAQDRLSRALMEAPEESGPLNPQKLVVRSMLAMGELSPGYLARFVSYVDTIFWLENTGAHKN